MKVAVVFKNLRLSLSKRSRLLTRPALVRWQLRKKHFDFLALQRSHPADFLFDL